GLQVGVEIVVLVIAGGKMFKVRVSISAGVLLAAVDHEAVQGYQVGYLLGTAEAGIVDKIAYPVIDIRIHRGAGFWADAAAQADGQGLEVNVDLAIALDRARGVQVAFQFAIAAADLDIVQGEALAG